MSGKGSAGPLERIVGRLRDEAAVFAKCSANADESELLNEAAGALESALRRAEYWKANSTAANEEVERLQTCLHRIKASVCGDVGENWNNGLSTTLTRCWIADVCDEGIQPPNTR